MPQTGVAGMCMRVDKPGYNRAASKIYFRSTRCRQSIHFFIGTHSQELVVGDGNRLDARLRGIHGQNVCVQQNKLRLAATQREQRQRSQLMQESTSRQIHRAKGLGI